MELGCLKSMQATGLGYNDYRSVIIDGIESRCNFLLLLFLTVIMDFIKKVVDVTLVEQIYHCEKIGHLT